MAETDGPYYVLQFGKVPLPSYEGDLFVTSIEVNAKTRLLEASRLLDHSRISVRTYDSYPEITNIGIGEIMLLEKTVEEDTIDLVRN